MATDPYAEFGAPIAAAPKKDDPYAEFGAPINAAPQNPSAIPDGLPGIPRPAAIPQLTKNSSGVLEGKPSPLIPPAGEDPRTALGTAVGAKLSEDVPNFLKAAVTPPLVPLGESLYNESGRFAKAVKSGTDPGAAKSVPDFLSKAASTVGSVAGVDTNKLAEAARNRDYPSLLTEGGLPLVENYALGEATGATGKVKDVAAELNPIKGPMKASGIGLSPVEKLVKAGGPSVTEANFPQAIEKAAPRLAEQDAIKPIKSVQDMADAAHDAADRIWKGTIEPQITRNANATIPGATIANKIRSGVDEGMADLFPDQAKLVNDLADKFDSSTFKASGLPLSKANAYLKTLNAQLKSYYRMSPEGRAASNVTDGAVSAMSDAADALRDEIYNKLEALGEKDPRDSRLQYGALKQIQKVFQKRAVVAGRQAPLNLQQALGLMAGAGEATGALATGHPLAAVAGVIPPAVATGLRYMNSPDSLTRRGIAGLTPTPATPGIVLPTAIGAAARQQAPATMDKLKRAAQQ